MSDLETPITGDAWRSPLSTWLLARLRRTRRPVPFDVAWDQVRNGAAPPLPPGVHPPVLLDSRMRLRAAYLAVPVLPRLHDLLPEVVVRPAEDGDRPGPRPLVDRGRGTDRGDANGAVVEVDCTRPVDVIAFALLQRFGHAVDRLVLDDVDRAALGHPDGVAGWRAGWLAPVDRGERWFADSFAHWWWPERMEAHRPPWGLAVPPVESPVARRAFDLDRLERRRSHWRG